ncbi:MAG: peptidylprolyl isomerase [Moorea sp. SIO1F2]|uniref:peptidylprolyl isomerase n=6 Tax=Moorena TaxID=1155738 RepID=A0A1D8TYI4_9CYAN|nr:MULTISPECIES: peptidylprolyl isomerase [Moorena]NEO63245.1 peptidylprolyl isomerase [Moorena sp. SIO4G2]NEO89871.1 peptidylprolyl isomerase [Moorena sp. SIO3G5]NEQ15049.1 peptidylprolyl isomerase [Moorena sp. SIO3E2]AOX02719.1 peptidylprolyl isomerase [Moorena producens PAL-8-15-08-1]AOY83124.1 peptidylprolyl isomerase [Moorena producens JHB]
MGTTTVLRIGDRVISAEEIVPLLAGYQLLPPLIREIIIDEAVATASCTPEEKAQAYQQFLEKNQLIDETAKQAWLKQRGMNPAQLEALAVRSILIEKYKQQTWSHKLESYFLERKGQLDRVIYSLIRTKDPGVAQEIYFRIQEGEESFADLAREYSQGPEAQTGGLIGPVELSVPHPALAQMLRLSQPGQLFPPTRLGEWLLIVRLEKFMPAQLDDSMRQRLLNECFSTWLSEQLNQQLAALD